MKQLLLGILCLTASAGAGAQERNSLTAGNLDQAGKLAFVSETHDFGEVPEGPTPEYDFEFTNTGKEPIVISKAQGSCGCTVPDWPKEPILPGKKGKIHVSYNTIGRPGPIQKDVYVTSNAQQSMMVLHIKGTVKARPTAAASGQ